MLQRTLRQLFASIAFASIATAQGVVVVKAGVVSKVEIGPQTEYTVPVILDMSNASGASVHHLQVDLTWNNSVLNYTSFQSTGVGRVSGTDPNNGTLTLTFEQASGISSTTTIANLKFHALTGITTLAIDVSALNLGPSTNARVRDFDVCVGPGGKWGDATGDGNVNILDAQQIARSSIGLSVANASAVSGRGDVTADGAVNVADAQQVARFTAGLSAAPRIGTPATASVTVASMSVNALYTSIGGSYAPGVHATPHALAPGAESRLEIVAKDAADAIVTPCANISYTSNSTSVATVSSDGVITAVAPGSATITASSGSASATQNLTVVPATPVTLAIEAQPSATAISDTRFTAQPVVRLTDGSGVTVTNAVATVTATIATGTGTVAGLTSVTAVNGVATFTDLRIIGEGQHTLSFTTSGTGAVTSSGVGVLRFVAAGGGHSNGCALTSFGAVYCWTIGNGIARLLPGNLTFASITGGGWDSEWCGLTPLGEAHCWEWVGYAGPGAGPTMPVRVAPNLTFARLSAQNSHKCGLTMGGAAYCWGANGKGQLGDGTTTPSADPVAVIGGHTFTEITAGNGHTCAIATSGGTYCWGENYRGELGIGIVQDDTPHSTPTLVHGGLTFTKLDAGSGYTCAIATGTIYCWGKNFYGNLGVDTAIEIPTPTPIAATGIVFDRVRATGGFTCGIAVSDIAYCWGGGQIEYGWFGNGERWQGTWTPTELVGRLFIDVQPGDIQGVVGITKNGSVLYWGLHYYSSSMYPVVMPQ